MRSMQTLGLRVGQPFHAQTASLPWRRFLQVCRSAVRHLCGLLPVQEFHWSMWCRATGKMFCPPSFRGPILLLLLLLGEPRPGMSGKGAGWTWAAQQWRHNRPFRDFPRLHEPSLCRGPSGDMHCSVACSRGRDSSNNRARDSWKYFSIPQGLQAVRSIGWEGRGVVIFPWILKH